MTARETWEFIQASVTGQFKAITIPDAPERAVPSDGFLGLIQNFRYDIVSGFIVFLIALPLSLGIAMASGLPPVAGLVSAAIGGVVVSQLSGSFVTINGPAAGLIVVVISACEALGGGTRGYHATLSAIVVSGFILFLLGRMRSAEIGKYFPATVVHAMLASIGIVIIIKQLPTFLGSQIKIREPLEIFHQLPHLLSDLNPFILLVSLVSLIILIIHPHIRFAPFKAIPAPLWVVLTASLMTAFLTDTKTYELLGHTFRLVPDKLLVRVPSDLSHCFAFPDFSAIRMPRFWLCVLSISFVQSVETVLSCAAVDKLDPFKRKANLSKDLCAVGLGSMVSAGLGGLPVIAEIVRSTANIASGARTRFSNFYHGLFLCLFVALASALLNKIPLAALAALLIFTGFRLASPKVFKETHSIGYEQTVIFVSTIFVTLATDLLIGVFSGIALKLLLHLFRGVKPSELFKATAYLEDGAEGDHYLHMDGAIVFSNYFCIKNLLDQIKTGGQVFIDFSATTFIDHTVMEHLAEFRQDYEHEGGKVCFVALEKLSSVSDHPQGSRRLERKR